MEDPPWLETAMGYLDLKMYEEAWEALDNLPDDQKDAFPTVKLRVSCRLDEQRYSDALEWCRDLCRRFPHEHIGFIQGAYCLHEMGKTREAQAWLQSGPPSLQMEAIYFYNLGCYDLALGQIESACAWLMQAFELEPAYYEDALKDPDFTRIIDRIAEMREEEEDDAFTD